MLSPLIQIVNAFAYLVGLAIPLLIGIALIVFFYGLIRYILDPKKENAKIIWGGLIALFVMVSVWGIVYFAQSALGIRGNSSAPQNAPYIPSYSGGGSGSTYNTNSPVPATGVGAYQ